MKAANDYLSYMIIPSNKSSEPILVRIKRLHIPRKYLMQDFVFTNILPVDLFVMVKVFYGPEKVVPYLVSDYQQYVDYVYEHIIYTFDYYFDFPLYVAQVTPEYKLRIKVKSHGGLSRSQTFDLFTDKYGLHWFNNGNQIVHFSDDGFNMYIDVFPVNYFPVIYHNEVYQQPITKSYYRNNLEDTILTLNDFEQIINGYISDIYLVYLLELEKYYTQSKILYHHEIAQQGMVYKYGQLVQSQEAGKLTHYSTVVVNRQMGYDIMSFLQQQSKGRSNQQILQNVVQSINYNGALVSFGANYVDILAQHDLDRIGLYFQGDEANDNILIQKNALDYVFNNSCTDLRQYQNQQQRYEQYSATRQQLFLALQINEDPAPDAYEVKLIRQVLAIDFLHSLTKQQGEFLYYYRKYIKDKFEDCFYRLMESFCLRNVVEQDVFERYFGVGFANVPIEQVLMIFELAQKVRLPFLRYIAVGQLERAAPAQLQEMLMQLTLQIQFDTERGEMRNFLTELTTSPENCFRFSQYYYYLQCWAEKCVWKKEVTGVSKFYEAIYCYMDRAYQMKTFHAELVRSIELTSELRRMISTVKAISNDRLEQLNLLSAEINKLDSYPTLLDDYRPTIFPFILRDGEPCVVRGLNKTKCHVFKSAKKPFLLYFNEVVPAADTESSDHNGDSECSVISDAGVLEDTMMSLPHGVISSLASSGAVCEEEVANPDTCVASSLVNPLKAERNAVRQKYSQQTLQEMPIIFKYNDDVRNDAMVLYLFRQMDRYLRNNQMFMEPTHYAAFAFDYLFGLVEVVHPVSSIDDIILDKQLGTIRQYFKHQNRISDNAYQHQMLRYVKSTAMYSIFTYVLGIGDRHLENILLQPNGRLVHIDFGWLFGRDPKPRPAKIKVSPEMVEALGGVESHNFRYFMSYLVSTWLVVRKNINVVMALIILLKEGGIKVVEEDYQKNFDWMYQRLQLDCNDEEASFYMTYIINEQLQAVFSNIVDALHRWIQGYRK